MSLARRRCVDKLTPAERAIYDALAAVEAIPGGDVRLTDAVMLLQQAKDRVGDFVDGIASPYAEIARPRTACPRCKGVQPPAHAMDWPHAHEKALDRLHAEERSHCHTGEARNRYLKLAMQNNEASAMWAQRAVEVLGVLNAIEEAIDPQIYPQQQAHDFDAPDDAEYMVTITAGLWRRIGRVLNSTEKK